MYSQNDNSYRKKDLRDFSTLRQNLINAMFCEVVPRVGAVVEPARWGDGRQTG